MAAAWDSVGLALHMHAGRPSSLSTSDLGLGRRPHPGDSQHTILLSQSLLWFPIYED